MSESAFNRFRCKSALHGCLKALYMEEFFHEKRVLKREDYQWERPKILEKTNEKDKSKKSCKSKKEDGS